MERGQGEGSTIYVLFFDCNCHVGRYVYQLKLKPTKIVLEVNCSCLKSLRCEIS